MTDKQRYEQILNQIEEQVEHALEAQHEGYAGLAKEYWAEVRRLRKQALVVQERLARAFIRAQPVPKGEAP